MTAFGPRELTIDDVQEWLQERENIYDVPDQSIELIIDDMVKTRFLPENRHSDDALEAFQDYVYFHEGQPPYELRRNIKTIADQRRTTKEIRRFLDSRGVRNMSDLHLRLIMSDMRRNNEDPTVEKVSAQYVHGRSPLDAKTKLEHRAREVRRKNEETIKRETSRQGFANLLERVNDNGDKVVDLQEFQDLKIFRDEGFDREVIRDVFYLYSGGDFEITVTEFQVSDQVEKIKNSLAEPDVSATDVRLIIEAMKQAGIRVRKYPQFIQFIEREGAADRLIAIRTIVRRVRRKMEYEIMKCVQSSDFEAQIQRCDRDGNRRVSMNEFISLLAQYDRDVVKAFFQRYANERNEIGPEEFSYIKRPFQEEYVVRRRYLFTYIFEEGKMRFPDQGDEEDGFPVFEDEDEALSVEPGFKLVELRDARKEKGMDKPTFESIRFNMGAQTNEAALRRILNCEGRERTTLPRRHKDFVKITIVKYMEDVRFDRGIDWILEDLFREYDEDNRNEISSRELNEILRKIDPSHRDVDEGVLDLDQFKEFFRTSGREKYIDRLRTESITLRSHDFENRPWHTWNSKQLVHWVRSQGFIEMARAFQAARLEGADLIGFSMEDLNKLAQTVRARPSRASRKHNFLMGAIEDLRQYRQYRIKRTLRVRTRQRGLYTKVTIPVGSILTVTDPMTKLSASPPDEFDEEDTSEDILIVKRGSGWAATDQIFMAVTTVQDIQEKCMPCPRKFSKPLLEFLFNEYAPHTVEDRPEELQRRCLEVAQSLGIATADDIYYTVFEDNDKWTTEQNFKDALERARTRCIIERTLCMGPTEVFLSSVRQHAPFNSIKKAGSWSAAEVAGFIASWVPPDQEYNLRGPQKRRRRVRMFGKQKVDEFDFDELPGWEGFAQRLCADVLAQNIDGYTLSTWGDKGVVDTLLWGMPPVYKYALLEELTKRSAPGVNVQGIIVTLLAVFLALLLWTKQTATGQQFWQDISGFMTMPHDDFIKRKAATLGLTVQTSEELSRLDALRSQKMQDEAMSVKENSMRSLCSPNRIAELCFATKGCKPGDAGICTLVETCGLKDACNEKVYPDITAKFTKNYNKNLCEGAEKKDLCELRDVCKGSTAGACELISKCNFQNLDCSKAPKSLNKELCRYAGSGKTGDPCLMRDTCGDSRKGSCSLIDVCDLTAQRCVKTMRKRKRKPVRLRLTIKTRNFCPGADIKDTSVDIVIDNPKYQHQKKLRNRIIKEQIKKKLSAKFGNKCRFDIKKINKSTADNLDAEKARK